MTKSFSTDLKVGETLLVSTQDEKTIEIRLDKKSGQVARLIVTACAETKISKQKQ